MIAPIDVHAVFPGGRRPPAKARTFVDHLAAALAEPARLPLGAPA